ncbi:MAG: crossover junction endodeoxyribonuclease RuvC [Gemmatimonadetes bacterium]|nr:crossover junction endodeoxyribonuclease RuvC [Gemmatimonadota bacterium]NIO31593.1 crossover junction endodeoxyribonuclease RuvC [Gemmatimonadota bacterium]
MIVLGVDPGTQITGYGVVARGEDRCHTLVECGAVRPTADTPLAERLLEIFEGVAEVIERTRPDVLCVEGVFYGRNVRTTVILGHARSAVMLAAAVRGVPVVEYAPAEVKNAVVGSGRARKDQVAFMVQKHLSLAEAPTPADAADGVALALCHLFRDSSGAGDAWVHKGVGKKRGD